ncbi:MAG: hypothetical protein ACE5OT_06175 [Candidatus Hadarchaeaceae archaeon]
MDYLGAVGAPRIKKGGEKEMTSKLPWATVAVIIIVAAIGAWAIFGGAPAAPPAGTATITAIAGQGTVFAAGVPPGTASGIENVYIIATGAYVDTGNLSGDPDILGVITASGGSVNIPYETAFDIVVAVKAGTDNMAYAVLENMNVSIAVSGSFTITEENATNKSLFENSGYGTTTGWIRVNAIWDNANAGYTLPAGGSITIGPIKLWGWK